MSVSLQQETDTLLQWSDTKVEKAGERIFRVGSVRYRMDPSRRTLQRISDDESMSSASINSGLASKKGYIPRRLVFGNDEYWLARKQKYCQFFTRFGKCNKDDGGKCPYIHDPSKIVVCTKFLKGLCSTPNCKLTHKVIPERMPDCSYFLQGLYSNESCPYRHVSVNPKASICKGFLKGYCADGNEEPLKKVDFTYMNSIMAMMKDPEVDKAFGWVLEM
ncbi:unnamed protein product [Trifolium pratense]|uniref:Uncharacterized protein n=2 Tax=Trifolium pratense TaxID=57577 RepID=A0ACB0JNY8_TRIPR|nr:unnamed protein product [Trifolium pratense]CAJ2645983.1 unnamed protein product [Trifolium pratense]